MAGVGVRAARGLCATGIVLGVAACSAPADTPGPATPPSTTTRPTSPSTTGEPHPPKPLRIAFAGDIHFEGVLAERLRVPTTALEPAASALAAADLAIVNLETSVGSGGTPEPGKRFTFSAGGEALAALSAAGVDVASMANNHALDYGRARLPSTMRAVRAAGRSEPPLSVVGIGRDAEEAFRPAVVEVGDTVVATLAASLADQDPTADPTGHWAATGARSGIADAADPSRLLAAVRRADEDADVVVVYLHWGIQGARCPSPDQRSIATRLVERGADVVVGSHAHQLQGAGRLGEGYVSYGLGNFAWYSPGTDETSRTGVLTLTIEPPAEPAGRARVVRASWDPRRIGADGLPVPVTGAAAAGFRAELQALRGCAGLGG
jgi:hypothetical protein